MSLKIHYLHSYLNSNTRFVPKQLVPEYKAKRMERAFSEYREAEMNVIQCSGSNPSWQTSMTQKLDPLFGKCLNSGGGYVEKNCVLKTARPKCKLL